MSDIESKQELETKASYPVTTAADDNGLPPVIDKAAERKLVRRMDLFIMPIFFYLYMLCFLDR